VLFLNPELLPLNSSERISADLKINGVFLAKLFKEKNLENLELGMLCRLAKLKKKTEIGILVLF